MPINPEEIHWESSDAREYLMDLGGSKSGAHAFLNDTSPDLRKYLPSGVKYLAPGEDVEKFLQGMDFTKSKVVRACHPLDVFGMVDVIPTDVDVRGREAVRNAVLNTLRFVERRKDVRSFVEYESGKPFDGKVGILVQDFCGYKRGSMVEHPHERNVFRVGFVGTHDEVFEDVCDENGLEINTMSKKETDPRELKKLTWWDCVQHGRRQKAIHLYHKVQESGLMPSSHSFQMEFGFEDGVDEVRFFQARLFRPFQPRADFLIEDLPENARNRSSAWIYGAIGITPVTGSEVMPRAELTKAFINRRKTDEKVAYAHNNFNCHTSTLLDIQPRNMHAYLPYQPYVLEHGYYRWMQKAPVTLIGLGRTRPDNRKRELADAIQEINENLRVRVYSNGIRGMLEFTE